MKRYLALCKETLMLLLLLVYLVGGQAARGTELLTIEHRNGASTSRGVYIYRGMVALVVRHNKTRVTTDHEFHVVIFLPPATSRLLYLYLVYVRPFAEMLRSIRWEDYHGSLSFPS